MLYRTDRYPEPGEVCTICNVALHKRAALLFDRIYVGPSDADRENFEIPDHLTFGFREGDEQFRTYIKDLAAEFTRSIQAGQQKISIDPAKRRLAEAYGKLGCTVVPAYSDHLAFSEEFTPSGPEIGFEAALRNIPVVSNEIDWKQIIEFRKDRDARRKYRDLRLWLRSGIDTETVEEASDLIGQKVDAYAWALRKHGLKTVSGALTYVLNYKQAGIAASAAAAGAALGGPVLSALAGGLVLTGQVSAWVVERFVESEEARRGVNSEIAYILEAQKRFPMD